MEWLGLIILLFILYLAIQFWHFVLPLLLFILVIYFLNLLNEKEKDRKATEAARKADQERLEAELKGKEEYQKRLHRENQDRYLNQLVDVGEESIALFERMPEHLETAEKYLNQAEFEFSEGAFAPFWDAIEKAAITLGRFDEGAKKIKKNSSHYTDLFPKYEGSPPQFPLSRKSVEKLSVGTSTSERMKEIVRMAQRNFQFATIYEQRKTNQILVAGFTNLAQALDQMTWQITDSINSLTTSVDSMASTLNESLSAIHSELGTIHSDLGNIAEANVNFSSEMVNLESNRSAREKRAIQMLDNIQHNRKPSYASMNL